MGRKPDSCKLQNDELFSVKLIVVTLSRYILFSDVLQGTASPNPNPSVMDSMRAMAIARTVDSLKVPELKSFLKGKSKISGLNKQQLCNAVYKFFNV